MSFESNEKRPAFGSRFLSSGDDVFQHNAWDNVTWDSEMLNDAQQKIARNSSEKASADVIAPYISNPSSHWSNFYNIHDNKFFKDRHWLFTEFPELLTSNQTILEVGCGVGNTVIPILQCTSASQCFIYCCDYSSAAIDILKKHSLYDPARCDAFCSDFCQSDLELPFKDGTIDVVVLVFVLSAVAPDSMDTFMRNVHRCLKPGGLVLFRDYGRYDLAQLRLKPGQCISDNFYFRNDGTLVYFFDEQEVDRLMVGHRLTRRLQLHTDRRLQVNRAKQLRMFRVWVQAKYRKPVCSDQ